MKLRCPRCSTELNLTGALEGTGDPYYICQCPNPVCGFSGMVRDWEKVFDSHEG